MPAQRYERTLLSFLSNLGRGERGTVSFRKRLGCVLSLALLFATGLAFGQPAVAQETEPAVYVKLTPSAQADMAGETKAGVVTFGISSLDALNRTYQASRMKRVFRPAGRFEARHRAWGLDRWYEISLQAETDVEAAARAYLGQGAVESASPVYEKTLHGRPTFAPPARTAAAMAPFVPDDPLYGDQWHYDNTGQTNIPADGEVGTPGADVNLPEAHEINTGASDVIISVVDSGIDLDHPDFEGMLWINSAEDINGNGVFDRTPAADGGDLDGVDNDNNGFVDDVVGYDFADNDPIPDVIEPGTISNSHGTHVAGTIAARNNNATGVAGVAGGDGTAGSGARLMITQTFANAVTGFPEAIVYAADNGAVISNNSWGYTSPGVFEQPVLDAIDYFNANAGGAAAPIDGGIVVTSAGNSDSDADWYPGFYEGSYAVSSTEDTDTKSTFSNFGSWVDVAAPGGQFGIDGVISTVHRDAGEYASFSGTSMSAPHVAGAAALLASEMPGMTAEEVKALIANAGVDISDLNPGFELGLRLDAFNTLQGPDDTPPAAVTDLAAAPALSSTGTSVTLTWTAPGDDGDDGQASSYNIRYSFDGPITEDSFDAATAVDDPPAPDSAGTAQSFTVEGLPFEQEIWFALKTADEFLNVSAVSNSPSVTTGEGPSFTVSTDSIGTSLLIGEQTTETFSIDNTGDDSLDVSFFGFAAQSIFEEAAQRNNVSRPIASADHPKGSDNLAGVGRPVVLGAGGPDDYGYNWIDSNEDGGPVFNWVDISATGTPVSSGDDTVTNVALPFTFSFYGEAVSEVGIGSNGYLIMGGGTSAAFTNAPIPDGGSPNNLVAPLWDDLNPTESGTIYTFYDEPNGRFIVQYDDVAKFSSPNRFTFQVILYENGTILFQYDEMDVADSATIGLENADGSDGLQVAFNTPYAEQGLAVAIQSAPTYLDLSPTSASIDPGASQTFTLDFDATGLEQGVFDFDLEATVSGSAASAQAVIATQLNVTGAPFPFELSAESFDESLAADESVVQTLTITNPDAQERSFSLELRGMTGVAPTFQPRLHGEKLLKYERLSASLAELAGTGEASLGAASSPVRSPFSFLPDPMAAFGLDAYATSVFGDLQDQFVTFDLNTPEVLRGLGVSPTAFAGDFAFGQQDRFYVITNADKAFHSISTDGEITTFGLSQPQTAAETWTELASDPTDGTLYGSTSDGTASYLYTLDPTDGSATRIATIEGLQIVIGIAVDDIGRMYALEIATDELYEIDPETGETTLIGPVGFNANFAQGMDYDLATGRLYLAAYSDAAGGELRIADTETGATTVVGPLGDGDELGYLALNSVGFVQPNLLTGTIAAGQSTDVQLTITADGLYDGTYDGELRVVSDVPGDPFEGVDVMLTVDADPVLAVDTDTLAYDSLFVGNDQTQTALVSNTGRADLSVDLSIDEADFAFADTSATSFTLPAGVSRVVPITFAPSTEGPITGTLTVDGGADGTESVALLGNGVPPPVVELSPTEFDLQAFPGQQYTRTLEMVNAGESPLVYSATETVISQPAGLEPGAVFQEVVFSEDFEAGLPTTWTVVDNAGTGVVWQLNGDWGRGNYAGTGNAAAVDSDESGAVPYDTELISPVFDATEGLALTFLVNYQAFLPENDQFFDVDISTDDGATWTNALRLDDDTPPGGLFVENGGVLQSIALDPYVDAGDTFQVRFRYYTTSDGFDWYAQIDDIRIVEEFEYVAFSPAADTVAPGDTLDVLYEIDATGLPGGTYELAYTFATNDPQVDTTTVPFTLNVIESLSVTPEPVVGTDSLVHPNETFSVPLAVESLDDLAVDSFELTLTFDSTLVEPTEVVTEGTLSEGLTLATNIQDDFVSIAAAENEGGAPEGASPVLFSIEGEGTLVSVTFQAKEALGTTPMSVADALFNEGLPGATGKNTPVLVAPLYGDASLNLSVNAFDAARVLQEVVGLTTFNDAAFVSGDVTGNGVLTAFDASLILDFASGLRDCFPVEDGCEDPAPALAAKSGSAPTLAWGEASVQTGAAAKKDAAGQSLSIPVVLRGNGDGVRSFELHTQVDPSLLTVEEVEARLPDGWQVAHNISDDGRLSLAAFGPTPLGSGPVAAVQAQWLKPEAEMRLAGDATLNEAVSMSMDAASLVTVPETFALRGNYPNPARSLTQIGLDLPSSATVRLDLYDLLGRQVQSIRDQALEAGTDRRLALDLRDVSTGVYFYRITVQMSDGERQVDTGRLTVVR